MTIVGHIGKSKYNARSTHGTLRRASGSVREHTCRDHTLLSASQDSLHNTCACHGIPLSTKYDEHSMIYFLMQLSVNNNSIYNIWSSALYFTYNLCCLFIVCWICAIQTADNGVSDTLTVAGVFQQLRNLCDVGIWQTSCRMHEEDVVWEAHWPTETFDMKDRRY